MRVLALISGGKDSILSLLHTESAAARLVAVAAASQGDAASSAAGGHADSATITKTVVALGNVHPASVESENATDSYMYQSAFANVTTSLAECLGLPIVREELRGSVVFGGLSYDPSFHGEGRKHEDEDEDEVESLTRLLARAKAQLGIDGVSVGAVLSTYQRTRVESVALRLGLTVFAPLWQFPVLPGADLLGDLAKVGVEARIVKVASGALDNERFLWADIVSSRPLIEKAVRRYGIDDGEDSGIAAGAAEVIGEGGEYESFVVASTMWRKRLAIEVDKVWTGAGNGHVLAKSVQIVENPSYTESHRGLASILPPPKRWDERFERMLPFLSTLDAVTTGFSDDIQTGEEKRERAWEINETRSMVYISNITSRLSDLEPTLTWLQTVLTAHQAVPDTIVSVIMLIRDSASYGAVNEAYSKLFGKPLPPARVAVFCGGLLGYFASQADISVSLSAEKIGADGVPKPKKGLHVQSRSFWAPANIGPYSQARNQTLPFISPSSSHAEARRSLWQGSGIEIVHLAGQIPLDPFSMSLPPIPPNERAALGMQHLTRVAKERRVRWFLDGIAFVAKGNEGWATEVSRAAAVWSAFSAPNTTEQNGDEGDEDEEVEAVDLWRARYDPSYSLQDAHSEVRKPRETLPDWSVTNMDLTMLSKGATEKSDEQQGGNQFETGVPFLAVVVEALPRDVPIEWWTSTALSFSSHALATGSVTLQSEPLDFHRGETGTAHITTVSARQGRDDDEEDTGEDGDGPGAASAFNKERTVLAQGIVYLRHLPDKDDVELLAAQIGDRLSQSSTATAVVVTTMRFMALPKVDIAEAKSLPGTTDIPCYALYNAEGETYTAVIICRAVLEA